MRVPARTFRRIARDTSTVVMRHARDGTVLDVGRKTRTIPQAIRRARSRHGWGEERDHSHGAMK